MIKLRFDHNRGHTKKAEDQKVILPVEKDLNEQELATVTGGRGRDEHHRRGHRREGRGCGCGDDCW